MNATGNSANDPATGQFRPFAQAYSLSAAVPTPEGRSTPFGTIVLLHGLTASPTETKPLGRLLQQAGFNLFVPRLAGHTGSLEDLRTTERWEWIRNVDQAIAGAQKQFTGPLFLAGESLGAILSLLGAVRFPKSIAGLALYAPPLALESVFSETVMKISSHLPDLIENRLPTVPKRSRPENYLAEKREALPVHSIAAAGRMASIRRMVFRNLSKVTVPILIIEDPYDHHLGPGAWDELLIEVAAPVDTVLVPGGEHELILGHRLAAVAAATTQFFKRLSA